jgi:GDP-4-dehydro-6-deoxy-D-mannose reductase
VAVGHVAHGTDRTVLITGATGFTGSSLVELYAARGWEVHGIHRSEPYDLSWVPPAAVLHQLDLRDGAKLDDLVGDLRPAVVHHLAANSSVAASWDDPLGTLDANASAQFHLLEAVRRRAPGARVVVAGSCDVYGTVSAEDNPVNEDHALLPVTPYALSKVVQDLMAFQYARVHGMAVIRSRPFLQLGPRRAARFVAGSFARQIAEIEVGIRAPVIEVGNIHLYRDFTDVRDVARALAALAEQGTPGEPYNIASGVAHSLHDMLSIMVERTRIRVDIIPADRLRRPNEAPMLVGDATKLHTCTGWRPEISFEQSTADTLAYWRERVGKADVARGEIA